MAIGENPHNQNSDDLQADFTSHHIEGYASAAIAKGLSDEEAYFSAPLLSHIDGNLWTGGCLHGVSLPEEIKYVISLYPWEQYALAEDVERHEFRAYDGVDTPEELDQIVDLAIECLKKGPTLIHCQAGLNRSGLIAALVLIRDQGMDPQEAINLLRDKRSPLVLCNQSFEDFLLNQIEENE